MDVENDLNTLKTKLLALKKALRRAEKSTAEPAEQDRIKSAAELPDVTLARIDQFLSGVRNIPAWNIFQSTIGNCTRGFPEIGADATENPGPIANMIKDILDFSITCNRCS